MDPHSPGWVERGLQAGGRILQSFQGSPGFSCPSLLRHCPCQGTEVTGVVLSLSSMLGTGVWAEGDLRPWQPWPEQKLALATSARTWEAGAALPIAAGE